MLELFKDPGISSTAVCITLDVPSVGVERIPFAGSFRDIASAIVTSGLTAITGTPDTGLLGVPLIPLIEVVGACLLLHFCLLGGGVGGLAGSSGSGTACPTNCPLSRARGTTSRFKSLCSR